MVAFACALPDVEMRSFYGTLCPKLGGKTLASPGREPGSFAVMCKPDEKAILPETDPDTFWQTRIMKAGTRFSLASAPTIPNGSPMSSGAHGGTVRKKRSDRISASGADPLCRATPGMRWWAAHFPQCPGAKPSSQC